MNVILIGYRASGKTSIGNILANQLWKDFVDTDNLTCKKFDNPSIAQIWEEHGEPAFREAECDVVEQVLTESNQIIALGGGTLMQERARDAVANAENTIRIYLKCDPTVLHQRITNDTQSPDSRPNLTAHQGSLEEIQQVLTERTPIYEASADQTFDVTNVTIEEAARYLIEKYL